MKLFDYQMMKTFHQRKRLKDWDDPINKKLSERESELTGRRKTKMDRAKEGK